MKIFHFITSLKIGGAESALVNFLRSVQRSFPEIHHEVCYIYDGPNVEKIRQLGISVFQLKGLFHHYDPVAFISLFLLIKQRCPDVIHTSLWSANIMGRLIGKMLSIPVVSDLHGSAVDEGRFRNVLDALTAHYAGKIVAVSPSVKTAYENTIIPTISSVKNRKKIENNFCIINNGIDVQLVRELAYQNPLSRSHFNLHSDHFVIGAVGRLEPIKSYGVLIQAFAYLLAEHNLKKQPKLCLVGAGTEQKKLEALAHDLDVQDHITFVGFRGDAIKFYPLFDCFALSSQSEGLSIALLEALCFGLPIVTTHGGEKHDVLQDGKNGFIVPVNNPKAFAQALKKLINNELLWSSMIEENNKLIQEYNLISTVKAYVHVYRTFFE